MKEVNINNMMIDLFFKNIECLSPRDQKVFRMRFGLEDGKNHTLEEVGKEFGVTRERIRQIETRCIQKLKRKEIVKQSFLNPSNREIKLRRPIFKNGKFNRFEYWSVKQRKSLFNILSSDEEYGDDEECTGLKDKNNIDIYENDIVEASNEYFDYLYPVEKQRKIYPNPLLKGVVEWNSYMANYEVNGEPINGDLDCYITLVTDTTCESDIGSNEIQIIGNIHENKKLFRGYCKV